MNTKGSVFFSPESSPSHVQTSYLTHNYTWWIVAAVLLVFLILVLLCFCISKNKKNLFTCICNKLSPKEQQDLDEEELILRRFQLEEVKKATNNFSKNCLVGSGAFGDVYLGDFHIDGLGFFKHRGEVAVKSKAQESCLLGNQVANILVYEFVPNGSLLEYIFGRDGKSLSWRERVKVAIGAAKGIAHLHHGLTPSIIHRDLKPSNIMIDEHFEAKVSDFGLVKLGPIEDQSHVSTQIKGTPGYLDPAYCSSCHLTPFTDVYSFGIILLQLVTARRARPCLESGNVLEILDARLLLEPCNLEVMLKMGQLGLKCVVKVPKQRPTMTQVWQELEEALNSADSIIGKRSSSMMTIRHDGTHRSDDQDCSQSFVSIDGIRLQRFHVDMDGFSMKTTSLKSFELASVVFSDDGDHDHTEVHVNHSSV
ncbi:probable serine/threonine-protein kinase PBL11 [Impatiens glandulifera]|uniref:probable serine/threonine-protein kinase PBL11 n=1 Tax=Impatiens glandulifera TaxID=253017 RepID=UPI001FB18669|nr:probable serine/threonine-protein kinase PBL11 [Impatiens glandulifera]